MLPNICRIIVISTALSGCATTETMPIINDNAAPAQTRTIVIQEAPPPVPYVSYYESSYPQYYHHYYNGGYFHHYRRW